VKGERATVVIPVGGVRGERATVVIPVGG